MGRIGTLQLLLVDSNSGYKTWKKSWNACDTPNYILKDRSVGEFPLSVVKESNAIEFAGYLLQ